MLAAATIPSFGWPIVTQMLAEVDGGGESKTLQEMTAAGELSTNEDPWLRVGKDGLFRGVICSDYGPQRDYAKLQAHRRHAGQGGTALRLEVLGFEPDGARLGGRSASASAGRARRATRRTP